MSDSISAIGAKAQAPPPVSVAKPQTDAAAAAPKNSVAVAAGAENAAVSHGMAASMAPEKNVADAEQSGTAAQGREREENYSQLVERQPFSKEDTQKAVESFMEYVDKLPREMKFTVDHDTNRQVFKIVNPVTQEVVKQFPPDEFLTMIKRLKEIGSPSKDNGIFFDERS